MARAFASDVFELVAIGAFLVAVAMGAMSIPAA